MERDKYPKNEKDHNRDRRVSQDRNIYTYKYFLYYSHRNIILHDCIKCKPSIYYCYILELLCRVLVCITYVLFYSLESLSVRICFLTSNGVINRWITLCTLIIIGTGNPSVHMLFSLWKWSEITKGLRIYKRKGHRKKRHHNNGSIVYTAKFVMIKNYSRKVAVRTLHSCGLYGKLAPFLSPCQKGLVLDVNVCCIVPIPRKIYSYIYIYEPDWVLLFLVPPPKTGGNGL